MADNNPNPEDFQEFLRNLIGGGGIDPEQLKELMTNLGGVQVDPAMFQAVFARLQGAHSDPWIDAERRALHSANQDGQGIATTVSTSLAEAFGLADLWLSESTTISELNSPGVTVTRGQWVEQTLPVWKEIADPVGTSIADALMGVLSNQVPEELRGVVESAGSMMRGLGSTMFAAQFGQVLGSLSKEVVSGGDVGIPVLPPGTAALVPQNLAAFGEGLEIPEDEIALYLTTRELAYARLYRHAKWLRLHVMSQITDFARGVTVDIDALEDVASRLDPSDPGELRELIESGALLPAHTEAQEESLARLENLIAVIDGWVDVVTTDATSRLPNGARIAEAARRRRAAGGPAEEALGALVGLKLRPRRLREAASMWRAITDAVGREIRDTLWDYPDLMPDASDIDDPTALLARLDATARGERPQTDDLDDALERLLSGESFSESSEDSANSASDSDPDEDPLPETERPV